MQDKYSVVVVIPAYKDVLPDDERKSLIQGLKILGERDIYIITHKGLDHTAYDSIAAEVGKSIVYTYFDELYFRNIEGYNKLCLSCDFYNKFRVYSYMLIYQLDAWVFADSLDHWCAKGYDYIGAPWFEDFGNREEGKALWMVGNGGLSLRRISYFCKVLSWKLPVMRIHPEKLLNWHFILYYLGHHNTISHFRSQVTTNEDGFFSRDMRDSWIPPRIPDCEEAIFFAFEQSPSYLFQLTNHVLPFGCHAYMKNEYSEFWKKYIK